MQELKDSKERFKLLAEATFEGIIFTDIWRIIDCNEQFLKMLGYEKIELVGRHLSSILSPPSIKTLIAALSFNSEDAYEIEIVAKNGMYIPTEVRTKIIQYGNEKIRVSVVRNLTTYKDAQNAITQAHKKLEDVLNSAIHTSIIASTPDGIITLFSKGAEKNARIIRLLRL